MIKISETFVQILALRKYQKIILFIGFLAALLGFLAIDAFRYPLFTSELNLSSVQTSIYLTNGKSLVFTNETKSLFLLDQNFEIEKELEFGDRRIYEIIEDDLGDFYCVFGEESPDTHDLIKQGILHITKDLGIVTNVYLENVNIEPHRTIGFKSLSFVENKLWWYEKNTDGFLTFDFNIINSTITKNYIQIPFAYYSISKISKDNYYISDFKGQIFKNHNNELSLIYPTTSFSSRPLNIVFDEQNKGIIAIDLVKSTFINYKPAENVQSEKKMQTVKQYDLFDLESIINLNRSFLSINNYDEINIYNTSTGAELDLNSLKIGIFKNIFRHFFYGGIILISSFIVLIIFRFIKYQLKKGIPYLYILTISAITAQIFVLFSILFFVNQATRDRMIQTEMATFSNTLNEYQAIFSNKSGIINVKDMMKALMEKSFLKSRNPIFSTISPLNDYYYTLPSSCFNPNLKMLYENFDFSIPSQTIVNTAFGRAIRLITGISNEYEKSESLLVLYIPLNYIEAQITLTQNENVQYSLLVILILNSLVLFVYIFIRIIISLKNKPRKIKRYSDFSIIKEIINFENEIELHKRILNQTSIAFEKILEKRLKNQFKAIWDVVFLNMDYLAKGRTHLFVDNLNRLSEDPKLAEVSPVNIQQSHILFNIEKPNFEILDTYFYLVRAIKSHKNKGQSFSFNLLMTQITLANPFGFINTPSKIGNLFFEAFQGFKAHGNFVLAEKTFHKSMKITHSLLCIFKFREIIGEYAFIEIIDGYTYDIREKKKRMSERIIFLSNILNDGKYAAGRIFLTENKDILEGLYYFFKVLIDLLEKKEFTITNPIQFEQFIEFSKSKG